MTLVLFSPSSSDGTEVDMGMIPFSTMDTRVLLDARVFVTFTKASRS